MSLRGFIVAIAILALLACGSHYKRNVVRLGGGVETARPTMDRLLDAYEQAERYERAKQITPEESVWLHEGAEVIAALRSPDAARMKAVRLSLQSLLAHGEALADLARTGTADPVEQRLFDVERELQQVAYRSAGVWGSWIGRLAGLSEDHQLALDLNARIRETDPEIQKLCADMTVELGELGTILDRRLGNQLAAMLKEIQRGYATDASYAGSHEAATALLRAHAFEERRHRIAVEFDVAARTVTAFADAHRALAEPVTRKNRPTRHQAVDTFLEVVEAFDFSGD